MKRRGDADHCIAIMEDPAMGLTRKVRARASLHLYNLSGHAAPGHISARHESDLRTPRQSSGCPPYLRPSWERVVIPAAISRISAMFLPVMRVIVKTAARSCLRRPLLTIMSLSPGGRTAAAGRRERSVPASNIAKPPGTVGSGQQYSEVAERRPQGRRDRFITNI